MNTKLTPVPDSAIDDLRRRLSATRHPVLPEGVGWTRGTDIDFLARLLESWANHYDWRIHEARILGLPWEVVNAGDRALRVVHQRAADPNARVVVLLHGWPDSILRFERVLPLLEDVHVVVPALPGYPFALRQAGMSVGQMASLVGETMQTLGYKRYVVSAGDVGADVAEQLSAQRPDQVLALHLTNVSPLHAVFADRSALPAPALAYLETVAGWQRKEGGYIAEQSTKPHSLAPGLADSPAGLAAWLVEKLQGWSEQPFSEEDLLTWISAYWFTNAIGSSFSSYVEFTPLVAFVSTPTVLSVFAHDTKPAPHAFAAQFVNLQAYNEHTHGGHFAAWEQPQAYVADLRQALALGYR